MDKFHTEIMGSETKIREAKTKKKIGFHCSTFTFIQMKFIF